MKPRIDYLFPTELERHGIDKCGLWEYIDFEYQHETFQSTNMIRGAEQNGKVKSTEKTKTQYIVVVSSISGAFFLLNRIHFGQFTILMSNSDVWNIVWMVQCSIVSNSHNYKLFCVWYNSNVSKLGFLVHNIILWNCRNFEHWLLLENLHFNSSFKEKIEKKTESVSHSMAIYFHIFMVTKCLAYTNTHAQRHHGSEK